MSRVVVGVDGSEQSKQALGLVSVSRQCAHHARCPVLILPPAREPKESRG